MNETVYSVAGMTCGHCAGAVSRALTTLDGVEAVDVDVDAGRVTVRSSAPLPVDSVRTAVTDAGYELTGV
ncbi:heavy-metal-associated domain-containing protein [Nocardia sp. BSTN01]|uniref:heavy-metal-associated domain-containing protein n=1 Tax=Nocardia sp. BSTN01 TaxID=2783665 RepID=UPI00188F4B2F|nr:heavy metal-associated domain-containing protein [Nocardia sp. BSTN01]MBF4996646.1 heavy-metal-associated domain-containing protein [Nocardia sp. BSTN01]